MVKEIPDHCVVLQQELNQNPGVRRIRIQNLNYSEFTTYIHSAGSLAKLTANSLRKEEWMDIVRLGIAAEQLKDIPVQTYVWEALNEKAERAGKKHDMFKAVDLQYVYDKTNIGSGLRYTLVHIGMESPTLMDSLYGPQLFFREMQVEVDKLNAHKSKQSRVTKKWISAKLKVIEDMRRCDEDSTGSEAAPSEHGAEPVTPVARPRNSAKTLDVECTSSAKDTSDGGVSLGNVKRGRSIADDIEASLRPGLRLDDYRRPSENVRKTSHPASSRHSSPVVVRRSSQRGSAQTTVQVSQRHPWSSLRDQRTSSLHMSAEGRPKLTLHKRVEVGSSLGKIYNEQLQRPVRQPVVGPSAEDLRKPALMARNFEDRRHE